MRINRLLVGLVLLAAVPAYAQFSKSTISSSISTQFPDQTTGQITPATTRAFLNGLLNSYQQYAGFNKQVGVTYSIQPSDYGQIVTFNNTSTVNVALSPASALGLTVFNFYAQNVSTGNAVLAPSAGTICGASVLTLANTQSAWIVSDGTNWQCQFSLAGSQLSTPVTVAQGGTGQSTASGTSLDSITGFALTGFLLRQAAGSYTFLSQTNGITLGNIAQVAANTTLCNALTGTNDVTACDAGTLSKNLCAPNVQMLTNGSNATYTTPTCNSVLPKFLSLTIVGGGGGGAGAGAGPGTATQGNTTCWNTSSPACTTPLLSGGGGSAAPTTAGTPTNGGTIGGSLVCDSSWSGGQGGGGSNSLNTNGSMGGNSTLGGGGVPGGETTGSINAGGAAVANTGGGGAGASNTGAANAGAGGGAGATCLRFLTSPAASYIYTIGTGGTGGTNGGAGAAGVIIVKAHWQ